MLIPQRVSFSLHNGCGCQLEAKYLDISVTLYKPAAGILPSV